MPVLPGLLALTNIADGALAVAADHRNNYAAIQADVNALLGILDDGAAGDVLIGVGTTLAYAKPPGYEYAYNEYTANVAVSSTTEGTPNDVVAASAVTFDGSTPVWLEFFSSRVLGPASAGNSLILNLWDSVGPTNLGRLALVFSPTVSGSGGPVLLRRKITPSAAAHTYKVSGWCSAGSGTVEAGAGGAGAQVPGFIRITKA